MVLQGAAGFSSTATAQAHGLAPMKMLPPYGAIARPQACACLPSFPCFAPGQTALPPPSNALLLDSEYSLASPLRSSPAHPYMLSCSPSNALLLTLLNALLCTQST
eukprot:scaffold112104_cov24-Tisochrysis_lutea.AAC.3